MDADLIELESLLDNCELQNSILVESNKTFEQMIDELQQVEQKQDRIIDNQQGSIDDLEEALKRENRKAKLYKVGMIVGFALVPVTVIYMMLNPQL